MEEKKLTQVNRRDFLAIATAAVGACGIGLATIPFLKAMGPTKDLIAAGVVDVDISGVKDGEFRVIVWRQQPVFILKRTSNMIAKASAINVQSLSDPATPEERVKRPEWLVCMGICTHLGCIPGWQPDKIPDFDQPGFYCPCHGGKYDSLGRRLAGPPPENLHLLPYTFTNDNKLIIGAATFAGYSENIRKISNLPNV